MTGINGMPMPGMVSGMPIGGMSMGGMNPMMMNMPHMPFQIVNPQNPQQMPTNGMFPMMQNPK
jgi:hypothetical protein